MTTNLIRCLEKALRHKIAEKSSLVAQKSMLRRSGSETKTISRYIVEMAEEIDRIRRLLDFVIALGGDDFDVLPEVIETLERNYGYNFNDIDEFNDEYLSLLGDSVKAVSDVLKTKLNF